MSTTEDIKGTGNGGDPAVVDRSAAGDVAEAITDRTPPAAMGFFVKCIGIGLILLCVGAGVSFVLYGGIFFKASAAAQVNGGDDKGLPPRLEIRKELMHRGAVGTTASIPFSQSIVISPPPVLKKD